jgi:hypothetical protein
MLPGVKPLPKETYLRRDGVVLQHGELQPRVSSDPSSAILSKYFWLWDFVSSSMNEV